MGFQKNDDYIEVADRIALFKKAYPDGTLQPLDPLNPFVVREIGGETLIVYAAAAFRTPDDLRPGVGVASEPFPGKTPYTKGSEIANAETSAWGRAIVALGIPSKHVASANEVRNRKAEQSGAGKGSRADAQREQAAQQPRRAAPAAQATPDPRTASDAPNGEDEEPPGLDADGLRARNAGGGNNGLATTQQKRTLGIVWHKLLDNGITEDELRSWLPEGKKSRVELTLAEASQLIKDSNKVLTDLTGGAEAGS